MNLVEAINHLGSQCWAACLLLCGSGLLVFCLKHNFATEIPSGIIGASLAMFQAAAKSTTTISAPNAQTQQVATGANPTQPS